MASRNIIEQPAQTEPTKEPDMSSIAVSPEAVPLEAVSTPSTDPESLQGPHISVETDTPRANRTSSPASPETTLSPVGVHVNNVSDKTVFTEENQIRKESIREIKEVYANIDKLREYKKTSFSYFDYGISALTLIMGALIAALETFWDGPKNRKKLKTMVLVCAILTSAISGFSIYIKGEIEYQGRLTGYILATEAATNDYRVFINTTIEIDTEEEAKALREAYRKWNADLNAISKEYRDVETRLNL